MKKILFLCFGLVVSVSLTAQLPERNAGNLKNTKRYAGSIFIRI